MKITTREQLEDLRQAISQSHEIAFDTETDSHVPGDVSVKEAKKRKLGGLSHNRIIAGYSICCDYDNEPHYVPIMHTTGDELAPAYEAIGVLDFMLCGEGAEDRVVWMHNAKFDIKSLRNEGIDPMRYRAKVYDSMILAWLIDPSRKKGLKHLVKEELGEKMKPFSQFKEYDFRASHVPVDKMLPYAEDDVRYLIPLAHKLMEDLEDAMGDRGLRVFDELECEVIFVTEEMEHNGVVVRGDKLEEMSEEFNEQIKEIEEEVASLVEVGKDEIKLNSTQWLSKTFIEQLGWWGTRPSWERNKSGLHSTKKAHMELWASGAVSGTTKAGQRIAELCLEYKGMSKLVSTYTEKLPKLIHGDGRLRGEFNQVGTATGRYSSKKPNLQNIPVRSENGRRIREQFVAQYGFKIVGADYSQIELRLLAHFSEDPKLLYAYNHDEDIHTQTAAEVFGCPKEDVEKEQRNIAKALNFGLIYGMGYKKLARTLKIPESEAQQYHRAYFETYDRVPRFQEATKYLAKRQGYISTLTGRRRYLKNINSPDRMLASFDERRAVNTRIQGSAGDLIKIAMRNIRRSAIDRGWNQRLFFPLLQIHDELIFEAHKSIADEAADMVQEEMESCVGDSLKVPLIAEPTVCDNWLEVK